MEPLVGVLVWSADVGAEVVAAVPVELPEPSEELSVGLVVEPFVGALAWSVDVGAEVGVAASVEPSGWQAVRAVDSISTARAAPAFRAARDAGLIRGWPSLRCQWSSSGRHPVVVGLHRPLLSTVAESGLRAVLGPLPGSRRPGGPARALSRGARTPVTLTAVWCRFPQSLDGIEESVCNLRTNEIDLSEETDHERPPPEGERICTLRFGACCESPPGIRGSPRVADHHPGSSVYCYCYSAIPAV